ncbi:hypothetical protein JCM8097_002972 [Rhodosporidiobolus ruineniae]
MSGPIFIPLFTFRLPRAASSLTMHRRIARDLFPRPFFVLVAVLTVIADLYLLYPVESPSLWSIGLGLLASNLVAVELCILFGDDFEDTPAIAVPTIGGFVLSGLGSLFRLAERDRHIEKQQGVFTVGIILVLFVLGTVILTSGCGGECSSPSGTSSAGAEDLEAGTGAGEGGISLGSGETEQEEDEARGTPGFTVQPATDFARGLFSKLGGQDAPPPGYDSVPPTIPGSIGKHP